METWFTMPVKVFLFGLLMAIFTTFTWHEVQIQAVKQAAVVAADTAANSAATSLSGITQDAQNAVDQIISSGSSSNPQTSISFSNDLVTATVSYQPENVFASVFSYLGVPTINQPIILSSSARAKHTGITLQSVMPNLQLYTNGSSPDVANVVSGYEEEIVGNLNFAGQTIGNANITVSVTGGTIGMATANPTGGATSTMDGGAITLAAPSTGPVASNVPTTTVLNIQTDSNGNFAFDYYAPNIIGQFSITASGDNATETIPIGSTPVVTVSNIANTYVNGSTTITGNVSTSTGSPVVDQPVTLQITLPDGTTQQISGGMTDSSGNFGTNYSPTELGGYMVKAQCQDGVSNLYGRTAILTPYLVSSAVDTNVPSNDYGYLVPGYTYLGSTNQTADTVINTGAFLGFTFSQIPSGYYLNELLNSYSIATNNLTMQQFTQQDGGSINLVPNTSTHGYLSSYNVVPNLTVQHSLSFGWYVTNGGTVVGGENQYFVSFASFEPIGTSNSEGFFGALYPQVEIASMTSSTPSLGSIENVTANATFDGQEIASGQAVQVVIFHATVNAQGQAVWTPVDQFNTTTTSNNPDVSFSFSVSAASFQSGQTYVATATVDGNQGEAAFVVQ